MSISQGVQEKQNLRQRLSTNKDLRGEPVHEAVVCIMRPAREIYSFWRDYQNLPKFMQHLKSIEVKSNSVSTWHWKALKDQVEVSWDSEIIQDIPGVLIGWRSVGDSQVTHEGQVSFEEQPFNRGTFVRVQLAYDPPGGTLTHFLEKILGESPENTLRSDLHRLRHLMEVGELPTILGQSHGGKEPKINPSIHH
jgi:uncharacterized membrane protein